MERKMIDKRSLIFLLGVSLILLPCIGHTAIPQKINYQGYLTNSAGVPITGTEQMVFRLYDMASGGSALWTETQMVTVSKGVYNVSLGDVTVLSLDFSVPYYLGVQVGSDPEMSPRIALTSAGYAFRAQTVESVGSHIHSGADITTGTVSEPRIDSLIARDSEVTTAVNAHATRTDNPHSTTAAQVGAVAVNQTDSITSGMIVDGQVGTSDINTSQVQRRVSSSCTAGSSIRVINADGTVSCEADDVGSFSGWELTGNAGTSPSTNFIGTTDNQVLAFRVNNQVAMRILPDSTSPNIIGGYSGNSATAGVYGASIGGGGGSGFHNRVSDHHGTVGGGYNNQAGDDAGTVSDRTYATVGGGNSNTASGWIATVGGGSSNTASGAIATVGGGSSNTASGVFSTVGGGFLNTASGYSATVGGGDSNDAIGGLATVPGGTGNLAYGDYSFAAGRRAKAHNQGCFVWADSTDADLNCTNTDRFVTRASGGYHLFTNSGMSTYAWLAPGESTWSGSSDRNVKENYLPTDGKEILISLVSIPITTWNYKSQDPSIRHMGPVAQDFSAAFGLGVSDKHINTIDLDGVALAAIQGLYEMVKEKEEEIERIARENKELREAIKDINKRLSVMVLPGTSFAEK